LTEPRDEAVPVGTSSPEGLRDLTESAREALTSASSRERTSDALYIVREGNYLFELSETLEEIGIELKEEVE
jgi:hypothetical protein